MAPEDRRRADRWPRSRTCRRATAARSASRCCADRHRSTAPAGDRAPDDGTDPLLRQATDARAPPPKTSLRSRRRSTVTLSSPNPKQARYETTARSVSYKGQIRARPWVVPLFEDCGAPAAQENGGQEHLYIDMNRDSSFEHRHDLTVDQAPGDESFVSREAWEHEPAPAVWLDIARALPRHGVYATRCPGTSCPRSKTSLPSLISSRSK